MAVCVLGDWGTGNAQSILLAKEMVKAIGPKMMVHLGDVYYAGTQEQFERFYLNVLVDAFGVTCPSDLKGRVWTLPGNHDYYAGDRSLSLSLSHLLRSGEAMFIKCASNSFFSPLSFSFFFLIFILISFFFLLSLSLPNRRDSLLRLSQVHRQPRWAVLLRGEHPLGHHRCRHILPRL